MYINLRVSHFALVASQEREHGFDPLADYNLSGWSLNHSKYTLVNNYECKWLDVSVSQAFVQIVPHLRPIVAGTDVICYLFTTFLSFCTMLIDFYSNI